LTDQLTTFTTLQYIVVLLRIQGLGFKDPTLWPFFAGERKSGSSRQGFESLLPGKKPPKLLKILQIWETFGTYFFLAEFLVLFGAFTRSAVRRFLEFGDSDPKDPDQFFRIGLKIRKSRSQKTGICNNTTTLLKCVGHE
jgi:hypothetical protein